jgi:hypothetical protein
MAAGRWSALVAAWLVGCSSASHTALPEPMPAPPDDSVDATPTTHDDAIVLPPPPALLGGQSGTDSSDAYDCEAFGAPPLRAVPLDTEPEHIACSPAAVLASIAGTWTFKGCVVSSTESGQSAGPVITLQITPGATAHLLDAVLIEEDGTRGSCDALGIDISLTTPTPGLELSADQVIVDHLCAYPGIETKGRLSLPLSSDAGAGWSDVDVQLAFDGLTGRVNGLRFLASDYVMNCVP